MFFQGISLQHFRSASQRTIKFSLPTTIVVAANAQGKTTLLEAIALLSTGESFRATEVEEMITFGQPLARVKGKIEAGEEEEKETTELEVVLTRGELDGKRVQSRIFSVNNVHRRRRDFMGKFFTVVFRPEDMRLIEGSPARRREFLNTMLSVSDPTYATALKTYEEALKRRNRLLQQIQEGAAPRTTLTYWTQQILKHGQYVQEHRRQTLGKFDGATFPMDFSIVYLPSIISPERMDQYANQEIAAGHTLIGPHKDDFAVELRLADGQVHPVAQYGSRGQQRMAVLWLKSNELTYLWQRTTLQPILLLDDILSELDEDHRAYVFSLLGKHQAIITTTEARMATEVAKIVGAAQCDIRENLNV